MEKFKNIEWISESWSKEVWFLFSYSTHMLTFSLVYFVLWKRYIFMWSVFFFCSSFEANRKDTPAKFQGGKSIREGKEKYWHAFMLPKSRLTISIWVTLGFRRMKQKVLCVYVCLFSFFSLFCTIFAYNFKTETHFKHQYQKLTDLLGRMSPPQLLIFIFLKDFCSFN